MGDNQEKDHNIEIWKMKKLIKALEASRGNGTSMISLIIPPRDQLSGVAKMLVEEYGTASNIKSRVNRQSVITSALQRLKLYAKVTPNGLVLYTGTVLTEDGKEKKVTFDFEPFRRFHTEALRQVLESDVKFGFIVMDGNGTLFGTLSGDTRDVIRKFSVDLPNSTTGEVMVKHLHKSEEATAAEWEVQEQIGGLLRYELDMRAFDDLSGDDDSD